MTQRLHVKKDLCFFLYKRVILWALKKTTYPQDYEKWVICHFKEDLKHASDLRTIVISCLPEFMDGVLYKETSLQAGS